MQGQPEREALTELLRQVRRRLFLNAFATQGLRWLGVTLPAAALAIGADQRWNQGRASVGVLLGLLALTLLSAWFSSWRALGAQVHAALALDHAGHLKDRVSSAWEFLEAKDLDEARSAQVHDTLRRVGGLDLKPLLALKTPRWARFVPVGLLLVGLGFLVPPLTSPARAHAASDPVKELQLERLKELQQDLAAKPETPPELEEVIKKLEEISRQFERGEMSERDLMLQLGRLDESLRAKAAQMGVENLEQEMNSIVPHLMANAATLDVAQAMKEQKLDQAAKELGKLADKVAAEKLAHEDKKKLAAHLGAAAAKLGKKKDSDSFAGDLAQASESLEKSDKEGFKGACKSMGNKLGLLKKCQGLKQACNKLGACKSCLGQCASECRSIALGKTQGNAKGGKGAGTQTTGNPFGDPNRLSDGLRKMLQISGQAGQGPVETETESADGQLSPSQLSAREVHANYAAVAEEVIDKEDVPLSHRYHVKRYFQAIRPAD